MRLRVFVAWMQRSGIRGRPAGRIPDGLTAGHKSAGGFPGHSIRLAAVPDSAKLHPGYGSITEFEALP